MTAVQATEGFGTPAWLEEATRANDARHEAHQLSLCVVYLAASGHADLVRDYCARYGTPAILLRDARDGIRYALDCLPIGVVL